MRWNPSHGSAGQGLIIEEESGRTVAVAYDEKDAPLLAAAPDLLKALQDILEDFRTYPYCGVCLRSRKARQQALEAISKAMEVEVV